MSLNYVGPLLCRFLKVVNSVLHYPWFVESSDVELRMWRADYIILRFLTVQRVSVPNLILFEINYVFNKLFMLFMLTCNEFTFVSKWINKYLKLFSVLTPNSTWYNINKCSLKSSIILKGPGKSENSDIENCCLKGCFFLLRIKRCLLVLCFFFIVNLTKKSLTKVKIY